jgi:flagellar biosynthesis component FlhA
LTLRKKKKKRIEKKKKKKKFNKKESKRKKNFTKKKKKKKKRFQTKVGSRPPTLPENRPFILENSSIRKKLALSFLIIRPNIYLKNFVVMQPNSELVWID